MNGTEPMVTVAVYVRAGKVIGAFANHGNVTVVVHDIDAHLAGIRQPDVSDDVQEEALLKT